MLKTKEHEELIIFMDPTCINNHKYFIIQLMHLIYKIICLLKTH